MEIVIAVSFQNPTPSVSIDGSHRHAMANAHLFGGEQPLGSQAAITTLQVESSADMGNLF
jgi:hypothetical protein